MRLHEEFRVDGPVSTIWEFFEEPDRVARCFPGVEQIRVLDADNVEMRATQSIGPMSATFEAKVSVLERQPLEHIRFQAAGKSVRGAVGNVRANNTVRLREIDGATLVSIEGDMVLAGALGSVGQKVVAKQAGKVTAVFADNLRAALAGDQQTSSLETAPGLPSSPYGATTPTPSVTTGEWVSVGNDTAARAAGERWAKLAAAFSAVAALLSLLSLLSQRRHSR